MIVGSLYKSLIPRVKNSISIRRLDIKLCKLESKFCDHHAQNFLDSNKQHRFIQTNTIFSSAILEMKTKSGSFFVRILRYEHVRELRKVY